MRVLVTGSSGYVGRAVCQRLLTSHEVIGFDQRLPDDPCWHTVRGDILNAAHLHAACHGADAVVHLAAIPNPSVDPADQIMLVNVMGTQRVLEAAALGSPRRVVIASSDSVYGFVFGRGAIHPEYLPVDEQHPCRPRDAYGLTKLINEETARRYTRDFGLETVCLRYCWVWDPRHYSHLAQFSADASTFVGQLWGYVDARDVAQAVEKSLVAPAIAHETLNISARRTFQEQPSLELARMHLPPDVDVRDPSWFAEEPHRTLLDYRRASRLIGYEPEYDCWEQAQLMA
ncbi:MAG: NAD(P)-dependent oxidoreductase [Armatimonadetes bacterium]|nr:NAD(P)-dependent oxidoreductase [Armatimonadota bacterium]